MSRDPRVYLDDILDAIKKIETYVKFLDFEGFDSDEKTIDAVVRNLEIIGEASNKLPLNMIQRAKDIEWNKMKGMRNILIHEYFGIDTAIIWDVLKTKLPTLKKVVRNLRKSLKSP